MRKRSSSAARDVAPESTGSVVTSVKSKEEPPVWWNPAALRLKLASQARERLIFNSVNASFAIARTNNPEMFVFEWEIKHGKNDMVKGTVEVTESIVLCAFGLAEMPPTFISQNVADRFGADFFAQGRAIRKGEWINIPAPGTGLPGDPNISLLGTDEVQKLVLDFMTALIEE